MNIIVQLQLPNKEDSTHSGSLLQVINISPTKGIYIRIFKIRGRKMGCDSFSHPTWLHVGLNNYAEKTSCTNSLFYDQVTPQGRTETSPTPAPVW